MEDPKWSGLLGVTSVLCHTSNEQSVSEESKSQVNSQSLTSGWREPESNIENDTTDFHENPKSEGIAEDVTSEEHRVAVPESNEVIYIKNPKANTTFLKSLNLPKIEVSPPDEVENVDVRQSVIEKIRIEMEDETSIPKIQVSTPVEVEAEIKGVNNSEPDDIEKVMQQFEAKDLDVKVQDTNPGSNFYQNIETEVNQRSEGRTHKDKSNNWLPRRASSYRRNKHPSDLLTLLPDTKDQSFDEIKSRLLNDFIKSTEYSSINEIYGNNELLNDRRGTEEASSKLRSRSIELGRKGSLSGLKKDGDLFRSMSYRETGRQRSADIHRTRSSAGRTTRRKGPETKNLSHGSVINLAVGTHNHSFRVRPNASPCFVKLEMPPIGVIRRKTVESERFFLPTNAPGEFVPDASVPAFEVLWLIHALLSFFGIHILIEDESGKFKISKIKLFMLFMHGILSILVFAYTLFFFMSETLPAWFVIYTWSYSCTQLFSLLQCIHVFRDRHKMILLLQELQHIRVENLKGFFIYPIVVFMYSILALFFLFIVMPPEAYSITMALVVSLFMPALLDMYVMSIVWIFISAYKSVHEDIINNFDWKATEACLLSKRLKHLNSVFVLFNELFSKKLLERRSLFMLQLLSYVYVLSALTSSQAPCQRLAMCTLLPCAEITIRLYTLCLSGDSLNKQFNLVHQALVEAYYFNYSLSTSEQEDTYSRKKSVVYTISSGVQRTRSRPMRHYGQNSRIWGSFASESSLNMLVNNQSGCGGTNDSTSALEQIEEPRKDSMNNLVEVVIESFDNNVQDQGSLFLNSKQENFKIGSNSANHINQRLTDEGKAESIISKFTSTVGTDLDLSFELPSTNEQTTGEASNQATDSIQKDHLTPSQTFSSGLGHATVYHAEDSLHPNKPEIVLDTLEHSAILEIGSYHSENHWNIPSDTKTDELQNNPCETEITDDSEQTCLLVRKEWLPEPNLVDSSKISERMMPGSASQYTDQDIIFIQQDCGLDEPNVNRLTIQDSENVIAKIPVFKIPEIVISEDTSPIVSGNALEDASDCEVISLNDHSTDNLSLDWMPKTPLSGSRSLYPRLILPEPCKDDLIMSEFLSKSVCETTKRHRTEEHDQMRDEIGETPQVVRSNAAPEYRVTDDISTNSDDSQDLNISKMISEENKSSNSSKNSGISSSDDEASVRKKTTSNCEGGNKHILTSNRTILITKRIPYSKGLRKKRKVDGETEKLRDNQTEKPATRSNKRNSTGVTENNAKSLKQGRASTNDGVSFSGDADSNWSYRHNGTGGDNSPQSDGDEAENYLTALQLLEMLLSRLEANPINVRIWGNSRLRSRTFVFVLGAVFSYIVVLLQAVPHRTLGSSTIHGIYDKCFDNGPADAYSAVADQRGVW